MQASLQTLMAAQGQPPGMYGGQGMALAGLGLAGQQQQQQQQSIAVMRLAQLSGQDMPGLQGGFLCRAPQGQIMTPAGQSSTVVQASPPNLQYMGAEPDSDASHHDIIQLASQCHGLPAGRRQACQALL